MTRMGVRLLLVTVPWLTLFTSLAEGRRNVIYQFRIIGFVSNPTLPLTVSRHHHHYYHHYQRQAKTRVGGAEQASLRDETRLGHSSGFLISATRCSNNSHVSIWKV
ncbi:hypothetical protein E2C01_063848 [Portunus trituberculatus]|uniref:Secreted protein n=1 Tax=Portunus trituberculatus TaxID=210409 RepID=A0A5B7HLP0_PORTR|nr:hypothetical protein [Portunus trituberculatus]